MTADRLRQLAENATPGPWRHVGGTVAGHQVDAVYGGEAGESQITRWPSEADAHLIALAPELAVLCADFAKWVDTVLAQGGTVMSEPVASDWAEGESLLERVERLGEPA